MTHPEPNNQRDGKMTDKPEIKKEFFVTHIGTVTVSNYGVVEFETFGGPRVILSVDTLYAMAREVRALVAEMRRAGEYAR